MPVNELVKLIVADTGMREAYSDSSDDSINKLANIEEFISSVDEFCKLNPDATLTDYLQQVTLSSDTDEMDDSDYVTLATVHAVKCLEFKCVFVVGLEENIMPVSRSVGNNEDMEEERRLMYVAMTRAERYLALTYAKSRIRYGKTEYSEPSRFLREIDPAQISSGLSGYAISSAQSGSLGYRDRLAVPRRASGNMASPSSYGRDTSGSGIAPSARRLVRADSSASMSPATSPQTYDVRPGTVIEHERFGVGRVEKVTGSGIDAKATVSFENAGTKQLMLKFARFKVVARDGDR